MDEIFENLRQLQDILSHKFALEREIEDMPKVLAAQEEALSRIKKAFIEKNSAYDDAKAKENQCKNDLKNSEIARENAEKNMETAVSQREYEARDKEIHDAKEKEQYYRKDLEQCSSRVAELNDQVKAFQSTISAQEKDLQAMRDDIKVSQAEKKGALDALTAEEKKLTNGMDSELLFKFERIIRNKGGKGIVAIKGGVCTGCHMILPAQFSNSVRSGESIVFCPYCSRILYHEEVLEGEEDFFEESLSGALADLEEDEEPEAPEDDDDGLEGLGVLRTKGAKKAKAPKGGKKSKPVEIEAEQDIEQQEAAAAGEISDDESEFEE
jgi:predicted  nucleic acid-binding Zn-ribbon protein